MWVYRYRTPSGLRQIKLGDYTVPGSEKVVMSWAAAQTAWMKLKLASDPTQGDPVEAIRTKKDASASATSTIELLIVDIYSPTLQAFVPGTSGTVPEPGTLALLGLGLAGLAALRRRTH